MSGLALSTHAAPSAPATVVARHLGRVEYEPTWRAMQQFTDERGPSTADELWFLEHPPVFTLGLNGRREHVLAAGDIPVIHVDRGGQVTYHGPGQLVGYPIFDLRPDRCDVHRYVRDLEEALILAVGEFGVTAGRVRGLTGVWVGPAGREEKLAAIGVRISRWITSHGFALNVAPDLNHFGLIVPCGIADRGITSLEQLLGRRLSMADVQDAVIRGFVKVFGFPARSSPESVPAD